MNRRLVTREKADLTLADLASGGLLTPEQSSEFFRQLIIQPTLLQLARVVPMSKPKREVNKIGFGARVLHAAPAQVVGTYLAVGSRTAPTMGKVTLDAKEKIAELHLPYDVLEDNIEGKSMADTCVAMLAEAVSRDIEESGLLGDTASGDADLAVHDGVLKLTTSNVVNAGGAPISSDIFKRCIKAMPDQFLRNRNAMRFLVSVDNETEYRDTQAQRATALGDQMLTGTSPAFAYGVPVDGASMMPAANAIFTNPKNVLFGFHREVSMEFDKDIRARVWIVVLTLRMDVKIEEEIAVVKVTNLG